MISGIDFLNEEIIIGWADANSGLLVVTKIPYGMIINIEARIRSAKELIKQVDVVGPRTYKKNDFDKK